MKFYEVLHRTAEVLAGDNAEKLFDYIIHSMDDNGGFLRTRFKRSERTLREREYDREPRIFLVALNSQFDLKRNTDYYDETTFGSVTALNDDGTTQKIAEFNDTFLSTILKMQIFYRDLSDEDKFGAMSRWSAAVGFPYPIRVDLENGTAEYLEKIDIIRS